MICPSCRAENIAGADHCSNCGTDLADIRLFELDQGPQFVLERLADLPGRPPAQIGPSDPVVLAVRLMQTSNTGCVLVIDDGRLAGIITTWDILHKVAGPNEDLFAVTCAQVMTADPVFLRDDDTVAVAINKMSVGGFRHIPLLEEGKPTKVIDVADVFRHISPHMV
jgi:CBS domain-containing protein